MPVSFMPALKQYLLDDDTPHAIGVTRLSLAISCVQGVWRPAWHTPLSCSVSAAAMGPLGDRERRSEFS